MSLYTTPLAAYTSQHVRGATSLPTDLTSSTRRQIPLPPMVVIRVIIVLSILVTLTTVASQRNAGTSRLLRQTTQNLRL